MLIHLKMLDTICNFVKERLLILSIFYLLLNASQAFYSLDWQNNSCPLENMDIHE